MTQTVATAKERLTGLRSTNTLETDGHPVWKWVTFVDNENGHHVLSVAGETEQQTRDTYHRICRALAVLDAQEQKS